MTHHVDPSTAPADLADLVAQLDAAIAGRTPEQACLAVTSLLPLLSGQTGSVLPASVFETVQGHYARRLLHVSPALGYSVVTMTWAPGQGTPIHDHDHQWCVDVVCQGELEVTAYQVTGHRDQDWQLEPGPVMRVQPGQCSWVMPPHEHHRIVNPSATDVAVSLHVYQGQISRYTAFDPVDGHYRPREVVVWLD